MVRVDRLSLTVIGCSLKPPSLQADFFNIILLLAIYLPILYQLNRRLLIARFERPRLALASYSYFYFIAFFYLFSFAFRADLAAYFLRRSNSSARIIQRSSYTNKTSILACRFLYVYFAQFEIIGQQLNIIVS